MVLVLLRFNLEMNAAELLEMGDRFDQTLLGHQCRLELENRQRQQRRQEFLDSVPDTKIDCPPVLGQPSTRAGGADLATSRPSSLHLHNDESKQVLLTSFLWFLLCFVMCGD